MGLEEAISLERSVDPIGAYDPTYYGFGDFLTGKKPQEYFVGE